VISAAIELTQLTTGLGSCDIDDIILNVFGAMLTCVLLTSLDLFLYLCKSIAKKFKKTIDKKEETR
jgi:glycopeptide antibiotics resistance protein